MAQDDTDDAKRNRPSRIGNIQLDWDASGNLIQKGTLSFSYDYRNRLTRVSDSGTDVARYTYDVFNRRVRKYRPDLSTTEEVAWSGWQEIEHYQNQQLTSRSVFGAGLDEIVHSQWDLDFDGQLGTDLYPVYDHTGHLAALTSQSGRIVGRYFYSPFGEDFEALVDDTLPIIEQLRARPPKIMFEPDGELWLGAMEAGIADGDVTVTVPDPPSGGVSAGGEVAKTSGVKSLSLSASQPIVHGHEARRRVELTIADPPAPGTEVELTIAGSAVRDLFGNQLEEDIQITFIWPDTDGMVLEDTAPPEITEIFLRDSHVEVTLSETPDMDLVPAAFQIDGGAVAWTLLEDTYTIRSAQPLSPGTHQLQVDPSNPFDLAGLGVASLFEQELSIADPGTAFADPRKEFEPTGNSLVYSVPDSRIVPLTTLANRATFHGRPLDTETGFVYFRNRYYDPEMGRFLTTDPLGYLEGPNLYAFVANNPVAFTDPLGLKTLMFVGRETVGVLPQIVLTALPEEDPLVDLEALAKRVSAAVQHYWGSREFRGMQVLFDVAILNTNSTGVRTSIIRQSSHEPHSYPYYYWVRASTARPRPTSNSQSDLLWASAHDSTLAHEAGHWMDWKYHPSELNLEFREGYLVPEGYYPGEGLMGNAVDAREVTALDVGAVIVAQGLPIGEHNNHEILAGYRSVSRAQSWIRDDLLVDRLDVYDGRTIRLRLENQHKALVEAGYRPRHEYVDLLARLLDAFRSGTDEARVRGVMEVFRMLAEVEPQ